MQETDVDVEINTLLEREVQVSYLPADLVMQLCDKCGAAAFHAWVVPNNDGGFTVMTYCNHHGRDMRDALKAYPHKDYRMTVDEAMEINAKAMQAMEDADRKAAATRNNGDAVNAEYRPVPAYLTQWDERYWSL